MKMTIKNIYYYLFYKLYKFSEAAPSKWWSDWKAVLAIDALWVFLGLSGLVYYSVITRHGVNLGDGTFAVILYLICIALPNYFIFHHQDQWKKIIHDFDKLPKHTNRIGGWIVFGVIILIIANLIFSFYL